MKRFIQSSLENLSIEVGSIATISSSKRKAEFLCEDTAYEGYIVSISTTYGREIVLGVYADKTIAKGAADAIKNTCVKDMLDPILPNFGKFGVRVDYNSSTVLLPPSSKKIQNIQDSD